MKMWREEPKELVEVQRLIISLFGIFFVLASLRMMTTGLGVQAKEIISLLTLAPIAGMHLGWYSKIRAKFAHRLAMRTGLAQEPGPKFLVDVTLRAEGRELGEDTGILSLTDGCLRYQGMRLEFSVPKDLVKRLDGNTTKVGIQAGEAWVWADFRERRQLEPQGVFSDLPYAFGNFWIGPSTGELRLPPTEKAPKGLAAERKRNLLHATFWVVLSLLGILEARSLAGRGLREAQLILTITFAVTALAAALAPVVRLTRAYRALDSLPHPEALPEGTTRTEIPAEEATPVCTTR